MALSSPTTRSSAGPTSQGIWYLGTSGEPTERRARHFMAYGRAKEPNDNHRDQATKNQLLRYLRTYSTASPLRAWPPRPPASSPLVARLLVTGAFAHHHAVRRGVLLGELGHRRAAPGLELGLGLG